MIKTMLMMNDDEATNTKKVLSKRKSSNSYKLIVVTGGSYLQPLSLTLTLMSAMCCVLFLPLFSS